MTFHQFIEDLIDNILKVEKGYVDDPHDRGGPTNYGITEAVARSYGYIGDMRSLPVATARQIYRRRYIIKPGFLDVAKHSEVLAQELVDTGVNMGPGRACEMLQRWLNAFNDKGSKYGDLFIDGIIGPVTLGALGAFLKWRGKEGEAVMLVALNCTQGMRYLEIAEGNPSQERFMYGWMRTRVTNLLDMAR